MPQAPPEVAVAEQLPPVPLEGVPGGPDAVDREVGGLELLDQPLARLPLDAAVEAARSGRPSSPRPGCAPRGGPRRGRPGARSRRSARTRVWIWVPRPSRRQPSPRSKPTRRKPSSSASSRTETSKTLGWLRRIATRLDYNLRVNPARAESPPASLASSRSRPLLLAASAAQAPPAQARATPLRRPSRRSSTRSAARAAGALAGRLDRDRGARHGRGRLRAQPRRAARRSPRSRRCSRRPRRCTFSAPTTSSRRRSGAGATSRTATARRLAARRRRGRPEHLRPLLRRRLFAVFDKWAEGLRQAGIVRVSGDLILNAALFDAIYRHPDGRGGRDTRWYQAPISALVLQRQRRHRLGRPGALPGRARPIVTIEPDTDVVQTRAAAPARSASGQVRGRAWPRPGSGPT